MKVIEKIEIEYVVPETEEERAEIEKIIKEFESNKHPKYKLEDLEIVDNSKKLPNNGYWRQKKV